MFVDEDYVDSRSDVDDIRTEHATVYGESRQVRYESCCVRRHCNRGRQSCSRLCHAQVANADPLGGRLSDVDVEELGKQFMQQRYAPFVTFGIIGV